MSQPDAAPAANAEEVEDSSTKERKFPSVATLLHTFWLRKWWALVIWLLLAIPVGVVLSIFNLPRSYTAATVMRFPNVVGAQTNVMRDVAITQGESIISVFNSFQVMEATIRKLNLRMRIETPEVFFRNTFKSLKYGDNLGIGWYNLIVDKGRKATVTYQPDGSDEVYPVFEGLLREDNKIVFQGLEMELKENLVREADGLVIGMDFKSMERAAIELRKGLSTRPLGISNYEIKYKDRDPWLVAEILNTLREQFLEVYYGTTEVQDVGILVQMEKDLNLSKEKLEKSQDDVSRYYADHPELVRRENGDNGGDNLSYLEARQDLERVSSARRRVTAASRAKPLEGTPEQIYYWSLEMLAAMADAGDPRANILRAGLTEAGNRQAALKAQLGPEHPRIQEVEAQKADLYRQLDEAQSALSIRLDQEVSEHRNRMASNAPVRQATVPVKVQLELDRLTSVNQNNQVIYDRLLESYNRAKLVTGSEFFKVTVVDPARPAMYQAPSLQNRLVAAVGAMFALFLLVPAAFVSWPLLFQKIWTKEDVGRLLRIKTLGVVAWNPAALEAAKAKPPKKGAKKGPVEEEPIPDNSGLTREPDPLLLFHGKRHTVSDLEAYRVIREETESYFRHSSGKNCLLITSTRPNEGKTLTACNLAMTFARKGKRTLLIDADFRLGRVDKILNLPPSTGVDELLAQPDMTDAQFLEMASLCFQPTIQRNLVVAPRRRPNPNAGELVSSDRFKAFIRLAREQFDLVIIDTPPIMITPEPLSLTEVVDGVLFVCKSGGTVVSEAQESLHILAERNVRTAAVVNGLKPSPFAENRYTKYSYYYQGQADHASQDAAAG